MAKGERVMRGQLKPNRLWATIALVSVALNIGAHPAAAAPTDVSTLTSILTVAAETNSSTYNRDYFVHWIDTNGNGCDTREEVLIAESKVKASIGAGCRILAGKWYSPYDNLTITNPGALDIDHFVPLHEAWESGASQWTAAQRQDYANDLGFSGSLIAVSASSNRSKSDQDPATWVPPYKAFDCAYVENWVLVKYRWSLTIDPQEKTALDSQLAKCPPATLTIPQVVAGIPSPASATANLTKGTRPTAMPSAIPTVSPTATPVTTSSASVTATKPVTPGAYCAAELKGASGKSADGTVYTCKTSPTDARLRWRR